MGGSPGLMDNMSGLTGKDWVLVRTLVLISKEGTSCGTTSRLNSGLHVYTHMHMYPHICVCTHMRTHTFRQAYLHMKK